MLHRLLPAVAVLFVAAPVAAQRLPANAVPSHYMLHVAPDFATRSFTGEETIDVRLAAASRTVVLNSLDLKLSSVSATVSGGAAQPGMVAYDTAREQATLSFAQPLPAGEVTLHLSFAGTLGDKLRGFYLSHSGAHTYAVTQFEATDARRAFPCFDEPALKATFDVSVTAPRADTVIGNMDVLSDVPGGTPSNVTSGAPAAAAHTVTFRTTPRMSTYLVAYIVGEFACERGTAAGTPIRVCAVPEKAKLTHFALTEAEALLTYYNGYFGIRYPLPKLDLIALADFEAGAMENFGAITFRETALLVDERSPRDGKKQVTETVAHEMAHQWFGDMVTMQWWNNVWLNEGFATWMEVKASARLHPEWQFDEDRAVSLDGVMTGDVLPSARTIRAEANTPAEISEMFDDVSYEKAGAVIGMVEGWLGEESFRAGVQRYLRAHLFANATAEDFWNAETAQSGKPVDAVMRSFVEQPGVPLLTPGAFTRGELAAQIAPFGGGPQRWTVPVCVRGMEPGQGCSVLPAQGVRIALPMNGAAAPFYLNAGYRGYYRTQYTAADAAALAAVAESRLTAPERIGLAGDVWAGVEAGHTGVGTFLDLAAALRPERDAVVDNALFGKLEAAAETMTSGDDAERLHAWERATYGPIYRALPPPSDSDPDDAQSYRALLFALLGRAGDPAVLADAQRITELIFTGKQPHDGGTADEAVALAAQHGTPAFYAALERVARESTDPNLAEEALLLLPRFEDPALVTRTLEFATGTQTAGGEAVRNQSSWELLVELLRQPATRAQSWAWIQAHWPAVQAQLTEASGAHLVSGVGAFCTVAGHDEAAAFFRAHPVPAAERALREALERSARCAHTHDVQEPQLRAWLAAHP